MQNAIKYSEKRRVGNLGEDIACLFLVKQGYRIVERNYLKKWGELDIVASRSDTMHFVEVKTVVSPRTKMPHTVDSNTGLDKQLLIQTVKGRVRNFWYGVSHETGHEDVSRGVSQNCFTAKDFNIGVSPRTKEVNISKPDRDIQENPNTLYNESTKRSWYGVSRETDDGSEYRPEENVHYWKQKRMLRAIQSYVLERRFSDDQEWQIDIITVKINFHVKTAIINHIENIVFDV